MCACHPVELRCRACVCDMLAIEYTCLRGTFYQIILQLCIVLC